MPVLSGERSRALARLTRRSAVLGTAMSAAAGLLVVLAPAVSAADSTTDLGVSLGFDSRGGDVAVGGGKVFVSAEDRIIVADIGGELTGAITGVSGAHGLAAAPDGTRLYAALSGSNEVAEIDTGSLEIVRRVALPAHPCPSSLALSGERLWVGHGCGSDLQGGVLSLDMSEPAPEAVAIEARFPHAPLVAAGGSTLVVGEMATSPADQLIYDVSGTPTLRGEIDGHTHARADLRDLAVTSDGSNLVDAFGGTFPFDRWDTTGMTRVRTYGEDSPSSDGYPLSVAISPDDAYIAGGREAGTDIAVYDATTGATTFAEDNLAGHLVRGSLTFSEEGLFGVLRVYETHRLHLWHLPRMTLPAPALTLTAPSGAAAGTPLTLTGRLALPGGSAPGAQPLAVLRRLPGAPATALDGVTTAADGTFTVTDTPPAGGPITYSVTWDGIEGVRWSRASVTAAVKHLSSLTVTGPSSEAAGTTLTLKGRLRVADAKFPPSDALLTVERTMSTGTGTVTTPLPGVKPLISGSYSFTDTPTESGRYTYTVRWAGDDAYGPAQAGHHVDIQEPNG